MSISDEKILSIIIPCYNEENNIVSLVNKVCQSPIKNKEIIVVDDCSNVLDGHTTELLFAYCDNHIMVYSFWNFRFFAAKEKFIMCVDDFNKSSLL